MATITAAPVGARLETVGVDTGTTTATTVTAGATANTKGAWASLGQTAFEWKSLILCVAQTAASYKAIDVGLSSDGTNFFVAVPDLIFDGAKYADLISLIPLPLRVPEGMYVGVRCSASTASHVLNVSATGSSRAVLGSDSYSGAIALSTVATSRGVVVDPGATANTKGSWVQLVASSAADVDAISIGIDHAGDVSRTANATALLDIGIGSAGNEFVAVPNLFLRWTTTSDGPFVNARPFIPLSIPAGSRIAARAQCTDVTTGDRLIGVSLHGWVA